MPGERRLHWRLYLAGRRASRDRAPKGGGKTLVPSISAEHRADLGVSDDPRPAQRSQEPRLPARLFPLLTDCQESRAPQILPDEHLGPVHLDACAVEAEVAPARARPGLPRGCRESSSSAPLFSFLAERVRLDFLAKEKVNINDLIVRLLGEGKVSGQERQQRWRHRDQRED